ncbi:chemotaxis protein CheD [Roseovarius atlanticus]|uniref:chemotaxis protein CheD n=1 Tax=Roseovarius atlanticus TaxID=1641875 RepID=UPI00071118A9|nr:chemotaxis protein CheD [Roseovarius atlanticus]
MTHLGNRHAPRPDAAGPTGQPPGSVDGAVFIPLFQGETRISDRRDEIMTTILGSCIATCMWDAVAGVGGMNHFLLPGGTSDRGDNMRYGVNAMELLINGLLKKGADRRRLEVKLFGGAKMFEGGAEIGAKNASFAQWYVENEGFTVTGSCLGGTRGRKIRFWPASGRVQQCFMNTMTDPAVPVTTRPPRDDNAAQGDIQLF